jgi:UDP-3-O-[3-hydroxymyristoyl] glucosamine N-acyltransferase
MSRSSCRRWSVRTISGVFAKLTTSWSPRSCAGEGRARRNTRIDVSIHITDDVDISDDVDITDDVDIADDVDITDDVDVHFFMAFLLLITD